MTQQAALPQATTRELSDAEAAATFNDEGAEIPEAGIADARAAFTAPPIDQEGLPDWAPPIPAGLKVPVGAQIAWMRIRAVWTAAPQKGDRVLTLWPLNEVEEYQAAERARGATNRLVSEFAKACIRAVDGIPVDRTGLATSNSAAVLWRDLGPKGRMLVRTYYTRAHSMSEEELRDFFSECFVNATAEAV